MKFSGFKMEALKPLLSLNEIGFLLENTNLDFYDLKFHPKSAENGTVIEKRLSE